MSDDLAVVGSDTLSAASVSSSGSNALSDVSKQLPQRAVDAWNATFNAAKAKAGPVSPNSWPAEAASPSNAQHDRLNFALPPGGTYDPETDTWERTQGAERQSWAESLRPSQLPSAFLYGLPESTPSSADSHMLPNVPTSPAAPSIAPGASFADRFGATTPAQAGGGTSAAAGATAQAPHSSAARNASATPSPIDPASLPPGPLNQADYARVGERNRYLASKYDPNNLYDRFINSFTGAMNDPANVRTPSEQAEHQALSQKIIDTVFPQPTVAEARLDAMEASPVGTAVWLGARQLGGSERTQDFALDVGRSLEGLALSRAGGQVLGIGASRPPTALGRVRGGPQFDELRDHATRHSRPTESRNQYYEQAVKHMQTGRRFTFYHDGQFKDAFITRNGPDSFTLTSANKSGKRVFTHMNEDVTTKYLRNIGITLPKGF